MVLEGGIKSIKKFGFGSRMEKGRWDVIKVEIRREEQPGRAIKGLSPKAPKAPKAPEGRTGQRGLRVLQADSAGLAAPNQ